VKATTQLLTKRRGELKDQLSPFESLRDRVRLGVSVAQGREEVHEILLLLRSELEIANLTVRCRLISRLGRRDSRDILHIVKNLGRREKRRVAGRRTFTEVKSYFLPAGVHSDVSLVVKMDYLLETLEDAVVHVSLHEAGAGSFVRVTRTRGFK
jgi:hypothetical protein